MAIKFNREGTDYFTIDDASFTLIDRLDPLVYSVAKSQQRGLYLTTIDPFVIPSRVYGDTVKNANRILGTYEHRKGVGTGVILAGEKGSGKSLLAKQVSVLAAAKGLPTIVVNHPYSGDEFFRFLQDLGDAVIIFDEFEKTYEKDHDQSDMLTLFDGTYPSHKLFILTCNEQRRLTRNIHNRPGRAFYMIEYTGLSKEFVREYCEENLKDKSQIDGVCRLAMTFSEFNFDMLASVVEEMNRYGESARDAVKLMNIKQARDAGGTFEYSGFVDGVPAEVRCDHHGSPLQYEILTAFFDTRKKVPVAAPVGGDDDEEDVCEYSGGDTWYVDVEQKWMTGFDFDTETITYEFPHDGKRFKLLAKRTRVRPHVFAF